MKNIQYWFQMFVQSKIFRWKGQFIYLEESAQLVLTLSIMKSLNGNDNLGRIVEFSLKT